MDDYRGGGDQRGHSVPGVFGQLKRFLFGEVAEHEPGRNTRRTDGLIVALLGLGLVVLLIYAWYASSLPAGNRLHFISWAVGAAFAAAICGGALGLLFGLPTVKLIQVRQVTAAVAANAPAPSPRSVPAGAAPTPPPADASLASVEATSALAATNAAQAPPPAISAASSDGLPEMEIPYNESTSLEQIADWLTKIIVGLTLTQFGAWSSRFDAMSRDVTAELYNQGPALRNCLGLMPAAGNGTAAGQLALSARRAAFRADCEALFGEATYGMTAGGILLIGYAVLGFLVAYLWMRRHFILEMVIARRASIMEMNRREATRDAEAAAAAERARVEQADQAARAAALKTLSARIETGIAEPSSARSLSPASTLERTLARAEASLPLNSAAVAQVRALRTEVAQRPLEFPDDPWRGFFGGHEAADGFRISADIAETADPNMFEVVIAVAATTPERQRQVARPETVLFFLHPTFGSDPRSATFGPDGRATLQLYAYGAFTVGALTESGQMLELNLAALEGAPPLFRQR